MVVLHAVNGCNHHHSMLLIFRSNNDGIILVFVNFSLFFSVFVISISILGMCFYFWPYVRENSATVGWLAGPRAQGPTATDISFTC